MTPDLFSSFRPNADDLLRRVSQRIDDQMLNEIAAADYGRDANEHLVHLRQIRDEGVFEVPMRWHPKEVLELIRWSRPEDPSWKPGAPGERGHWMRAFACAALLRAAGDSRDQEIRDGWNSTLIQLIDSLRMVGPELFGPGVAFLAWLIPQTERLSGTEDLAFFLIGLLWLALHLPASISDNDVVALSARIVVEVQRASEECCGPHPERGLLGTTFYNLTHMSWERLGLDLVQMDINDRSPPVREWISRIGGELAPRS